MDFITILIGQLQDYTLNDTFFVGDVGNKAHQVTTARRAVQHNGVGRVKRRVIGHSFNFGICIGINQGKAVDHQLQRRGINGEVNRHSAVNNTRVGIVINVTCRIAQRKRHFVVARHKVRASRGVQQIGGIRVINQGAAVLNSVYLVG